MSDAREVILQGAHGDIDIHENGDFHMTCPMSRATDAGLAALAAEGLTICRKASTGRTAGDDGALMCAFVPVLEHTPEGEKQ